MWEYQFSAVSIPNFLHLLLLLLLLAVYFTTFSQGLGYIALIDGGGL
jgi:hypothetical protein